MASKISVDGVPGYAVATLTDASTIAPRRDRFVSVQQQLLFGLLTAIFEPIRVLPFRF
jgi:hypothetical protein